MDPGSSRSIRRGASRTTCTGCTRRCTPCSPMAALGARGFRCSPRNEPLAVPVHGVEDALRNAVEIRDVLADDRDAALRCRQHDALVALLIEPHALGDLAMLQ